MNELQAVGSPNVKVDAGVEEPKLGTGVDMGSPLTVFVDWPNTNGFAVPDCVWSLLPENAKGLALAVDLWKPFGSDDCAADVVDDIPLNTGPELTPNPVDPCWMLGFPKAGALPVKPPNEPELG